MLLSSVIADIYLIERKAENGNEGFSRSRRGPRSSLRWFCKDSPTGSTSCSALPLLIYWLKIDGDRQMVHGITCQVFFESACHFQFVAAPFQMVLCNKPSGVPG